MFRTLAMRRAGKEARKIPGACAAVRFALRFSLRGYRQERVLESKGRQLANGRSRLSRKRARREGRSAESTRQGWCPVPCVAQTREANRKSESTRFPRRCRTVPTRCRPRRLQGEIRSTFSFHAPPCEGGAGCGGDCFEALPQSRSADSI